MKKVEAMTIVPKRAELLIEYVNQILSDDKRVYGEIEIASANINNERRCTYEISVPASNFEKHINTDITLQQCDVLNGQILSTLVLSFAKEETIGITPYYSIKSMSPLKSGINIINQIGSIVHISFLAQGQEFESQIEEYNNKLKTATENKTLLKKLNIPKV